ncbi:hypothetical protein GCM10011608_60710 [Micromonospora sonchi]|uniref:Uncharacterized protein n=1 Tax=Micromonospora sonchi TaxID=1763543 RepID=A0A917UAS8_9ACTN|nr:hypothetical protein GCM10011608_60710 [Micromonospora sonchi]
MGHNADRVLVRRKGDDGMDDVNDREYDEAYGSGRYRCMPSRKEARIQRITRPWPRRVRQCDPAGFDSGW